MRSVKSRLAALAVCALLAASGAGRAALAQGYRVQVYNPGIYSSTRQAMSNRAAARAATRAALKRKQRRLRSAQRRRPSIRGTEMQN